MYTVFMEKAWKGWMPTEFQHLKSLIAFTWLIFISTEVSYIMRRIYSYKYSFNISLLQVVVYN